MHKSIFCSLIFCAIYCTTYSNERITPGPVDSTGPGAKTLPYIFPNGTGGYSCYRIPAIVRTKKGTLLAFAEGRKKNCKDEGDIDLVLKRSTDNGKTWSDLILVWEDGDNTCGNPAPVIDERTGNIHLLMTWNLGEDHIKEIDAGTSKDTRRVFAAQSGDDGLHWTPAKEITASVKRTDWSWYATGPCHGIQIAKGLHAGRLVIPCDHHIGGGAKRGYSHVIYSDDSGATWQLGGISPRDRTDESTVAALSDGRLMLNMRNTSRDGMRMVATSADGGTSWSDIQPDSALVEPVCQGSLLAYRSGKKKYTLLFSNPAGKARANMTIKMSTDNGRSWKKSYTVYSGPAAYSDLVMVPGKQVAILYEAGVTKPYEGIAFEVISLDSFK